MKAVLKPPAHYDSVGLGPPRGPLARCLRHRAGPVLRVGATGQRRCGQRCSGGADGVSQGERHMFFSDGSSEDSANMLVYNLEN